MAREQGTFDFSFNFERKKKGKLDATEFVEFFSDLLNFTENNFIPEGFTVTVAKTSTYNGTEYPKGIYQCIDEGNLNLEDSWEQIGSKVDDRFSETSTNPLENKKVSILRHFTKVKTTNLTATEIKKLSYQKIICQADLSIDLDDTFDDTFNVTIQVDSGFTATLNTTSPAMVDNSTLSQGVYFLSKKNGTDEFVAKKQGLGNLIRKDEGNGKGYFLSGQDRANHGDIGSNAVDLSVQVSPNPDNGATGDFSHAEGSDTTASGLNSHAEGSDTTASGNSSHAEGSVTIASGNSSHAEGSVTIASGNSSHAEGSSVEASGYASHAEGGFVEASSYASHAEGNETTASGAVSHAEGNNNFARAEAEHSGGEHGTDYTPANDATDRLVNYGNGTGTSNRSDAFTIYKNGAVRFFREAIANITNTIKEGLLIFDSSNNNRPTIHNGTEWKGLAYVDEIGSGSAETNLNLSGAVSIDITTKQSYIYNLTGNIELNIDASNVKNNESYVTELRVTTDTGVETLTLLNSIDTKDVYGSFDPTAVNKIVISATKDSSGNVYLTYFINQPN